MDARSKKTKILVVDDDPAVLRFLQRRLTADGFDALAAIDGEQALELVESELPSLVILDIMMPDLDGFEICRRIREWSQVPIIFLSARGAEDDRVLGLNIGADDYLCKPFAAAELKARIEAVLRRTGSPNVALCRGPFVSGNLAISFAERMVTVGGEEVRLTRVEYGLLQELALNAGKVLSHSHLLKKVWGPEYETETHYLRVFVNRLRTKLRTDSGDSCEIVTVPGVGYQLRVIASTRSKEMIAQ